MGFSQPQLETLLETAVLERGIPLIRGYGECVNGCGFDAAYAYNNANAASQALKSIEHKKDSVTGHFAYVPAKNGPTTNGHTSAELDIKASYLIGCDGANSAVRAMMDISSTDLGFENDWLVLDLVSSTIA